MDGNHLDMANNAHQIIKHRFEPKRRELFVESASYISPRMRRIIFSSPDLVDFTSPGADDHIKLIFGVEAETGKPLMRDFTPRAFSREAQMLTIDFAIHDKGPASDWAREAKPGNQLTIAGPRGSTVVPGDFDWYMFLGDETALPAISRRLEELPETAQAVVVVIVDGEEDVLELQSAADVRYQWHYRTAIDYVADGYSFVAALTGISKPAGDGFVWIAAEAQAAKAARQYIVDVLNHPAGWLRASGYWSRGAAAIHEPL